MLKFILPTFLLISCSGIKPINNKKASDESLVQTKAPIISKNTKLVSSIKTIELQPGKVKFVEFDIALEDGMKTLNCRGTKTDFLVEKKKGRFLMAESYFSSMKPYECLYKDTIILSVKVKQFPYKSEKLNVDKKRVTLSKKDLARVIKEREILKKIYKNSASYYLFDKPFIRPLNSFITSHYGNRRVFNNKKKSQHLGNDLRAAVGLPIPVANKGKVVFTGHLFYSGNIVIVDHGLNLYSLYGHLSKIKVAQGMIINQGEIVGLAGATGRVSGPHLHWGIKLNSQNIDGFSLVDESKKMFGND